METEGTRPSEQLRGSVTETKRNVARGNKVVDRKRRYERQKASNVRRNTMWSRDADDRFVNCVDDRF